MGVLWSSDGTVGIPAVWSSLDELIGSQHWELSVVSFGVYLARHRGLSTRADDHVSFLLDHGVSPVEDPLL